MSIFIEDADDPRLAPYHRLRERDLAREGLFVAEGEVVVRRLLDAGRPPLGSLLLSETRAAALRPALAGLAAPVYIAPQRVLDAVAGYPIHRGVLALGVREPPHGVDTLLAALPPRALVLVLMGIANHDNMGGIFRNAAAFGADAVLLDTACCDPLYRKAIRVSVGASALVPTARLEGDVPSLLERSGFTPLALSPRGDSTLTDLERPARAAVLLGAEGRGLPAPVLARVRTIRIPMAAGFDSLNVATTSGIVLHHLLQVAPDESGCTSL